MFYCTGQLMLVVLESQDFTQTTETENKRVGIVPTLFTFYR